MSKRWRWLLILAYPLLWFNALTALLYAIVWCRATSWQWREGVLSFIAQRRMVGHPGGQGWSWVIGYSGETMRNLDHLRVHENCHVAQESIWAVLGALAAIPFVLTGHWMVAIVVGSTAGGLGFILSYSLFFLIGFAARGFKDWRDAYLKIPYEKQAYAKQDAYRHAMDEHRKTIWGDS